MIISNLRIENKDGKTYLIADIKCSFSTEQQLWFSLSEKDGEMFSDDVYDAFMVAALFPCMFYNEPITIEGKVSKELYYNLTRYAHSIITAFRPELKRVGINVSGFAVARQSEKKVVGTGFSGGVDSFATIVDHYVNEPEEEYKINHLFFFNLGQYGDPSNPESFERAVNRYNECKKATDCIGLPYSFMDTNLFKFYKPEWEHLADELNRAISIFSIQRVCSRYYASSAFSYEQHEAFSISHSGSLGAFAEHMLTPLLYTDVCKVVLDGSQYTKIDKINIIKDYFPAQKYLNVCTNINDGHTDGDNCSLCGKCLRTMCELYLIGAIDKFSEVFEIDKWYSHKYTFLCTTRMNSKYVYSDEIIELAKEKGCRIPSFVEAFVVYNFNRLKGRIKRELNKIK